MRIILFTILLSSTLGAQELVVKKHLPLTRKELQQAQNQINIPFRGEVTPTPFDDSYVTRMDAFRQNKLRTRRINGATGSSPGAVPLMIPFFWATFD